MPTPWLTHGFDHLLRTPGLSAGFLLGAVSVFAAFCNYASACFCVSGIAVGKGQQTTQT